MATPILASLVRVVIKKVFEGKRGRRRRYVQKQNIVKTKSDTTTRNLTGKYSFLARYERVRRKKLPTNVTIKRAQTIGPRLQRKRKTQQRAGILGSVFNLGKRFNYT